MEATIATGLIPAIGCWQQGQRKWRYMRSFSDQQHKRDNISVYNSKCQHHVWNWKQHRHVKSFKSNYTNHNPPSLVMITIGIGIVEMSNIDMHKTFLPSLIIAFSNLGKFICFEDCGQYFLFDAVWANFVGVHHSLRFGGIGDQEPTSVPNQWNSTCDRAATDKLVPPTPVTGTNETLTAVTSTVFFWQVLLHSSHVLLTSLSNPVAKSCVPIYTQYPLNPVEYRHAASVSHSAKLKPLPPCKDTTGALLVVPPLMQSWYCFREHHAWVYGTLAWYAYPTFLPVFWSTLWMIQRGSAASLSCVLKQGRRGWSTIKVSVKANFLVVQY